MSKITKAFGKRVRDLRAKNNIGSQMDLAHKSKLDRTYIGGIERGERNPSLKNIEKIAKALKVQVKDLF